MKVIVDTSVWSLALRRKTKETESTPPQVSLLRELIQDGRAALFGAIRQELLPGIRIYKQYESLRDYLRAFPDISLEVEDYELAANYFNTCRQQVIQGANTDFLVCAVANRRRYTVLTTDGDFELFSRYIPVDLV